MMLKVNNEYIYLTELPEIVQQAKTADLVDSAGDFSYQFDLPYTSDNARILGITSFQTFDIDAELVSNGESVHIGTLSIERVTDKISCSFTSGNTEWFTTLGNKLVSDIPINYLDRFKFPIINTSPSADLVASWSNTEGIVFPFVDLGRLRNVSVARLDSGDFLPFAYIRDVFKAMMLSNGFKLTGDLFKEGLYNTLIAGSAVGAGSGQGEKTSKYFEELSVYVGKTTQTINTVAQKVTFPTIISQGFAQMWDATTSRYGPSPYEMSVSFPIQFNLSASSTYTIQARVNGVTASTLTGTGDVITGRIGAVILDEGDTVEIWASVSSGTVNILDGSTIRVTPVRFENMYPHFLFGSMTQADLTKSLFTMFNVLASYDKYTKTITCNLFEKVADREPQDLSEYISSWEINTIDPLKDLAKDIIFKHLANDGEVVQDENENRDQPFGSYKISPIRTILSGVKEIETIFTDSKDYLNDIFKASLMDLGAIKFDVSESLIDITSVADDGAGIALFTSAESHNLKQLDYVTISNSSVSSYNGLGLVNSVPSDTTFKIQFLPFNGTATAEGHSTNRSGPSTDQDTVYIGSYFPSKSVRDFSFNTTVNYAGTTYSTMAWAFFLKQNYGLNIDALKVSPAFGQDETYNQITLGQTYYGLYKRMITNPVKVIAKMKLPELVYKNLDFSRPAIVNTVQFSWRFFIQKNVGYKGSELDCEVHLMRING